MLARRKLRILIVEDEFIVADDLARALTGAGAEVLGPASSVKQAMELLETSQPDISVLDINLQGQMAFDLADEMTARGILLMFATGYEAEMIPQRYRRIPCCGKPFRADAVAERAMSLAA